MELSPFFLSLALSSCYSVCHFIYIYIYIYSIKYISIKKCCQNIHILNSMILQLINIIALWNTDVISWRDKLHSVRITSKVKASYCNGTNARSYKVVMYIQKLHHFHYTFFPDDGPWLLILWWVILCRSQFNNFSLQFRIQKSIFTIILKRQSFHYHKQIYLQLKWDPSSYN